jgi:hypothetical protein
MMVSLKIINFPSARRSVVGESIAHQLGEVFGCLGEVFNFAASAALVGVVTTSVRKMNLKADSAVAQAGYKIITPQKNKNGEPLLL